MKVKSQEYSGFVYTHVEGRTGSRLTKFWDVTDEDGTAFSVTSEVNLDVGTWYAVTGFHNGTGWLHIKSARADR